MAEPLWSEESGMMKTIRKWNRPKREFILKPDGTREYGMNANGFEPFPKMLYKAQIQPISNKYEVCLARDVISADKTVVILSAEQFNTSCQMNVNDEDELSRAKADGWRDTPKEALEYADGTEQQKAVAAAVRNFEDRNMSEKAQAEIRKIEQTTGSEHVPEIPEQRRRGRKPGSKNKPKPSLADA
jgi:hypothetical protein